MPAGAPASAPNLVATAGVGQITLRWEAVEGAASYELWTWWDGDVGWQRIGGVLTGTSYTHANLTAGTTYYYTIRALNENGRSPWSAFASAAPEAAGALASAPNLVATAGVGQVALRWEAVEGAASYELRTWWDGDVGWQRIGGDLTGTSYTHANLTAGTTYYYTIRALNENGGSPWSAFASATLVPAGAPASAPNLVATAGVGQVALRWEAVEGAASYELWTWWDGDVGWQHIGGVLTGTSYTHANLTAGTTYYYTIRAVNENGRSHWSAFASATPV